jgi:hypothetical protein
MDDEAQRALDSLLDIGLGDILGAARVTVGKLREPADPERDNPQETGPVPRLELTVCSKQWPVLDFTYSGHRTFSLSVAIEPVLRPAGMVLRVQDRPFRKTVSGTCSAAATLSVAGVKLVQPTAREIILPMRRRARRFAPRPHTDQLSLTSRLSRAPCSLRAAAPFVHNRATCTRSVTSKMTNVIMEEYY